MGKCKKPTNQADKNASSLKSSKQVDQIGCAPLSSAALPCTSEQSQTISRNMRSSASKGLKDDTRTKPTQDYMLSGSSEQLPCIKETNDKSEVTKVISSLSGTSNTTSTKCSDESVIIASHVACSGRTRKQLKQELAVHIEKLDGLTISVSPGAERKARCSSVGVKLADAGLKPDTVKPCPITGDTIAAMRASQSYCAGKHVCTVDAQSPVTTHDNAASSHTLCDMDKVAVSSYCKGDVKSDGLRKVGNKKSVCVSSKFGKRKSLNNNPLCQKLLMRELCKKDLHASSNTPIVADEANLDLKNENTSCQELGDKLSKTKVKDVDNIQVTDLSVSGSEISCADSVNDPIPSKQSKLSVSTKRDSKHAKHKNKLKPRTVSHSDAVPTTLTRSMIKVPWLNSTPMTGLFSKKPRKLENEVWLNRRLEQQACMLWSSEQKRRFQQQYPDSSNELLEDKMRSHWEAQSDRDRQRYIQRARQATQSEHNRQLGRRCLTQQQLSKDDLLSSEAVLSQRLQNCTAIQLKHLFHAGSAQHQYDIIQHKLWSLQRRLFTADYRLLGRYLYSRLLLAMAAGDAETQPCSKTEKIGGDAWLRRIEESGRLIIYSAIEELESSVDSVVSERFISLQKQAALQYRRLLIDITDDPRHCSQVLDDRTTSAQLTQLLDDLLKGNHTTVEYDLTNDDRAAIEALERELSNGWFTGSTTIVVDGKQVVIPEIACSSFQKLLLHEASQRATVIPLRPDDVEACLGVAGHVGAKKVASAPTIASGVASNASDLRLMEAAGHVYRMLHGVELCCGLDSPSCVLSCLLVIDKLDRQSSSTGSMSKSFKICHEGCSAPALSQSWSDEKMLKDRLTVDAESGAVSETVLLSDIGGGRNEHGIYGIDTWLTSPIESSSLPATSRNNPNTTTGCDLNNDVNSEHWIIPPDDFNYMSMMHEGCTDLGIAL